MIFYEGLQNSPCDVIFKQKYFFFQKPQPPPYKSSKPPNSVIFFRGNCIKVILESLSIKSCFIYLLLFEK